MFHDPNLEFSLSKSLAFDLNAPACKLMLLISHYRSQGERILPTSYLKRLFKPRAWELATKGSRVYEKTATGGRRLVCGVDADGNKVPPRPARDGCEAAGLISEHRELDENGHVHTYWIIGEIDADVIAEIKRRRDDAAFDVLEDVAPSEPVEPEPVEDADAPSAVLPSEADFDRGYAAGEAAGYARGYSDGVAFTGLAKSEAIDSFIKGSPKASPVEGFISVSKSELKAALDDLDYFKALASDQAAKRASEKHLGF